jgi:dephospho-CoA kinase
MNMIWLGLTGGVASGKTTVANFFREKGVPIIDADRLAHTALARNKDKIVNYFGRDILGPTGDIDRKALGLKVFNSTDKLKFLESLIHPFVQKKTEEKKSLFKAAGHKMAIYDVPLLFENELQDKFDKVIVVYVPESLSLKRLMKRNSLSQEEAKSRLASQMDIEKKKKKADIVIDNKGDLDELKTQVDQVYRDLLSENS